MDELLHARNRYQPKVPQVLQGQIRLRKGEVHANHELKSQFPHTFEQPLLHFEAGASEIKPLRVGVVLSGGQAPGGHNVIAGLFDGLPKNSKLFGFKNGPKGIVEGDSIEITEKLLAPYRNTGGFDLIGSGRTKIETKEQFEASKATVEKLKLDGLVVIGGDDSNTNAAFLAEFLGPNVSVVGVPKTIDGDLQNEYVEIPFGFDSACKVYSEMIGNIARDALSAKKYTHFIKLMGRSASHVTLECALVTQPNLAFIGEEIAAKKMSLQDIVKEIVTLLRVRATQGKKYGVLLIPEGLLENIGEITKERLPEKIQKQLMLDRDPHGNVNLSHISTEELLIEMVRREFPDFTPVNHFFGYEGRSGFPSNFDANYCYSLGLVAVGLIQAKATSYMCGLQYLDRPAGEWQPVGVPLVSLMAEEVRKGKKQPVIKKTLVDLNGAAFKKFEAQRERLKFEDDYKSPGPIQYFGPEVLTEKIPMSLQAKRNRQVEVAS